MPQKISRSSPVSTCLTSLPESKKGDILSGAGSILSGLGGYTQDQIDRYKFIVYRAIVGELRYTQSFAEVRNIIEKHREYIIELLKQEKCMWDRPELATMIIQEMCGLYKSNTRAVPVDVKQKNCFYFDNTSRVEIVPIPQSNAYSVQIHSPGESVLIYECARYEVDVDAFGRDWVTLYDQDDEILRGYAFVSHVQHRS